MKKSAALFVSFFALAAMAIGCGGDDSTTVGGSDAGSDTSHAEGGGPADGGSDTGLADTGADTATEGGADSGGTIAYVASLGGGQETPSITTTATGTGTFTLNAAKTQLTYHVTHNVVGGSAAHLHLGFGGEAGAVAFPLMPFSADMTGTITVTAADAAHLEAGQIYVNVHSATNTDGEIRGQLLHTGEILYTAKLTGAQEVPAVTTTGTGTAAVIVSAAKDSIKYHLKTSLTPTSAHIHNGIGGAPGAVVHALTPNGMTIDGTVAITATEATDAADGHWYANVHTTLNAGGEIRGQFLVPGEVLYTAVMAGTNEVPPTVSTATGGAQFILNYAKTSLRYEAVFTNLTATLAHIHTGTIGVAGSVLYPLTLNANMMGAKGTQAVTSGDVANLDAAGLYANAHSTMYPSGEIRDQIRKQ